MKKYLIIIFSLLLILGCRKNVQLDKDYSKERDSLSYYLTNANNDSLNNQQRFVYNSKAYNLIKSQKNDSLNRINYFKVANRYFNIDDLDNYIEVTSSIVKLSKEAKDTISLAKAYSYTSDYYLKKNYPDSSYKYTYEAEKLYKKLSDKSNLARTLLNKAILQHNESDFLGCEKTVFEILNILKYTQDYPLLFEANNLLGIIYAELDEYDLSQKYYFNALNFIDKPGIDSEFQLKATTLNNIGILYNKQNKNSEAITNFKNALNQKNLLRDQPSLYAMLKDNLAYSKFKLRDFQDLPDIFFEALKIKTNVNHTTGIISNKLHLSEYYSYKSDTLKAYMYAKEAYDLAINNKEKRDALGTLKQLANVDPKNALVYSTEYFKINDSLQTAERKARNKFARIEYETEELTLEKDKLVEQRKTLIYIGLGIILIGAFIFVIRVQIAKNRELKLVQEQQKANEEIYQLMLNQQNRIEEVRQNEKKRIAQELHDGILGKLFGTRMNLGVLNSKKDDEAISERGSYIDELKTLEQEIREISHDLNTEKTAVFNNFVLMVTNFLDTQKKVCKATISFKIDPDINWNTVENMAKINFYRILQEAFQNINKHANAQNVSVTFARYENRICLDIEDDGVGFVYARKKKGIGLVNMKARILNSGGEMIIQTAPQNGTLLRFEIPLHPNTNT